MLNLSARTHAFRTTQTASERLDPPDAPGRWHLVDFRPLPVPSPQGLGLVFVGLWAAPRCVRCGELLTDPEHATPTDVGPVCSKCIEQTGGPMHAAQLCPLCHEPVPADVPRDCLPYCGQACARRARERRAELDPASAKSSTALPHEAKTADGEPPRLCGGCRRWGSVVNNMGHCNLHERAAGRFQTCDSWAGLGSAEPDPDLDPII